MSHLDAAFIKAYNKNETAGVALDTLLGGAPRGEPIADELPGAGSAPSLGDLYRSHVNRNRQEEPVIEGDRANFLPEQIRAETPVEAAPEPVRPRLATHTIDESAPPRRGRPSGSPKGPSARFRGASLQTERPHAAEIESPTPTASAFPSPYGDTLGDEEPRAESEQLRAWKMPALVPQGLPASFQLERFTFPPLCLELEERLASRFDALCEQLMTGTRQGRKLLGALGCRPRSGVTTLVLCLARRLAAQGLHVAIADCDLARPQLAATLGVQPQFGWQEAIAQDLPLGEALVESAHDRLTLAPLMRATRRLDALQTDRLTEVLGELREAFDVTLIDLGSLQASLRSGVLAAAPLDGVLLARDMRHVRTPELSAAVTQIEALGIRWHGVAENFV